MKLYNFKTELANSGHTVFNLKIYIIQYDWFFPHNLNTYIVFQQKNGQWKGFTAKRCKTKPEAKLV